MQTLCRRPESAPLHAGCVNWPQTCLVPRRDSRRASLLGQGDLHDRSIQRVVLRNLSERLDVQVNNSHLHRPGIALVPSQLDATMDATTCAALATLHL